MYQTFEDDKKPRPATKEWFLRSLCMSPYFQRLGNTERDATFELFCNQLTADVALQQRVIDQNFVHRRNVPAEIVDQAKVQIKHLRQLELSPPLMEEVGCPLENAIEENWYLPTQQGITTIPGLIEDFVHGETAGFEYAPTAQKTASHAYARYDAVKHPRVQEYLNAIKAFLSLNLPKGISQEKINTLLVRTGSAILPDILHILNFEARKHIPSPQNEQFIIQILTESPYFEAGKAINAMQPPNANIYDGWTFYPPGNEGLSGPAAVVTSTECKSEHIWDIYKSLQEGGIFCFYIEPIGNNPSLDVPNLKKVIDTIKARKKLNSGVQKVFLVIDTSIMGGNFDLSKFFTSEDLENINVIVTQSVNKYLTYGTNKANLGLVYGAGPDADWFFDALEGRIQMSGQPDIRSVLAVPLPDKQTIDERKQRFAYNTQFLAKNLTKAFEGKAEIIYPGLENHPQYQRAQSELDFQGSIFFVKLPNEEAYEAVEKLIASSTLIGLGTSYGFNSTRAEVIRKKMTDGNRESVGLRVSTGTENIRKLILVYEELQNILKQVLP